jgi:hypothetical protein
MANLSVVIQTPYYFASHCGCTHNAYLIDHGGCVDPNGKLFRNRCTNGRYFPDEYFPLKHLSAAR